MPFRVRKWLNCFQSTMCDKHLDSLGSLGKLIELLRWNVKIARKNHNGWNSLAPIISAISALENIR